MLPAVRCLSLPVLCLVAPYVRCFDVLCWRACVAFLCCALIALLRWSVSCGAACGSWLFVAGSCCPLLFLGGALRLRRSGLAAWPATLLLVVVCSAALLRCAVSCGAVALCGAVLSCPGVSLAVLLVFVCPVRPGPTMIRGAGPHRPWDAAAEEWLQAAPKPPLGWIGDVSSLIRAPIPPLIVLHTANVLRATEIHTWGRDAATIRWRPPEGGAARPTVAHFKTRGPVYDDALSRLGDILGPLLLMLPTDLAAALRQELDGCEGLRAGSEAVADGNLLTVLHRDAADECQWGALVPHLARRHTYMATPPRGHPYPAWDDLIAAFHDHRNLPDDTWQEVRRNTLGRDYRRRVRARLLELPDPLHQRWDDLWLRRLGPWSPPSHLPHTYHLCGECDTVSSAALTGANRCAQCSQVAACPSPEPPASPHRRTEEEALHWRIEDAHAPSHERAGPAGAALLWIHVHLRDPTSVAHLSHVFAT